MLQVETKEFVPTLIELETLTQLWNRSKTVLASTLASSTKARLAWTTRNFVASRPGCTHRDVYNWLERYIS